MIKTASALCQDLLLIGMGFALGYGKGYYDRFYPATPDLKSVLYMKDVFASVCRMVIMTYRWIC